MGFFSYVLGVGKYRQKKLSDIQHPITKDDIEQLISKYKLHTLSFAEEKVIEKVITQKRFGDGKISLRQIDEALGELVYNKKISIQDRKAVLGTFEKYFAEKFTKNKF